jgi:hypothetical protein
MSTCHILYQTFPAPLAVVAPELDHDRKSDALIKFSGPRSQESNEIQMAGRAGRDGDRGGDMSRVRILGQSFLKSGILVLVTAIWYSGIVSVQRRKSG